MASSDVDQKHLGRIANRTASINPLLSGSLYQLLGLSVILSRKLVRARKLRKLDTSRDTKSLSLYHHILWLSREGLSILELNILPYTQDGQHGPECRVLGAKLRASFYHIFCLFHNQPPLSQTSIPTYTSPGPMGPPTPLTPRQSNGQIRKNGKNGNGNGHHQSPKANQSKQKDTGYSGRAPTLREPITSITSETSFLTNPYANSSGGGVNSPAPAHPPGLPPVSTPRPSAFLLPPLNFLPLTSTHFTTATNLAATFLPGSHPLRLSVALEQTAFMWDCLHDHEGARRLARKAIRDVYRAKEGMDDADFEDAAELVGLLGKVMRRKSWEGTPRAGGSSGTQTAEVRSPTGNGDSYEQAVRGGAPPSQRAPQKQSPPRAPAATQVDQIEAGGPVRSPRNSKEKLRHRRSGGQSGNGGSKETTPRDRGNPEGLGSGGSSTPRTVHPVTTPTRPEMAQKRA